MTEPSGRPVRHWTPAELGVHQDMGGGPLPAYVRRPHDERLRAVLDPDSEHSRLVVIRGDALSGKSRALYEAVRDVLADWVLEYLPTTAALSARLAPEIPGRTVLWLGDLRHHADADGGGAVLERLDHVLENEGPVVAIATIWPGYWDSYTAAAAAGLGAADPVALVGRLLAPLDELAYYDPDSLDPGRGGVVDVPDRFTAEEMTAAAGAGDPVLAAAVAAAGADGQITQHLAGAAELMARYAGAGADPYGRAIITAALDATRLGHAGPLPAALLRDAAPGYLTGADHPAGSWDVALAWATDSGWALRPAEPGLVGYRVAGYLDQHGRRSRGDQLGPASLWDALTIHAAGAADLGRLAQAARDRGLDRYAAAFWTAAAEAGRTEAAGQLVAHLAGRADQADAARWAAEHAPLEDPWDVARLVRVLQAAAAGDALEILLARDPAEQVSLQHHWDVAELLRVLRAAGAADAARRLAARAAGQVSLFNPSFVAWLLPTLRETGAVDALDALAARVAADSITQSIGNVSRLLAGLHAAGTADAVRTLASRTVEAVDIDDPDDVDGLLTALRAVGAEDQVRTLLALDPGRSVTLDRTGGVAGLLAALHAAGAADQVRTLAARAAEHASLDDAEYAARLLQVLLAAGEGDAVQVLLARDPAGQVSVDFAEDVAQLLDALHAAGAGAAAQALAARVVDEPFWYWLDTPPLVQAMHTVGATDVLGTMSSRTATEVPVDDPGLMAVLLEGMRAAGSTEAIQVLLDRDPAGQADLADPWEVAELLTALHAAAADQPVRALASRAALGVPLDDPGSVAWLLAALRRTGTDDAAHVLAARAAHGSDLRDAHGVARLIEELRAAGAADAVRALLARDPGRRVDLGTSQPFSTGQARAVGRLLTALREAGAQDAEHELALRAADAGMFGLYLQVRPEQAAAYRFGREPAGTPSPPWVWAVPGLP